jgi:hypothetical protein
MIVTSVDCCYHGDEPSRSIKYVKFDCSGIAGFSSKVVLPFCFLRILRDLSVCLSVPFRIVDKNFVRIFDLRLVRG